MTLDMPREGACQLCTGSRRGSEDPLEDACRTRAALAHLAILIPETGKRTLCRAVGRRLPVAAPVLLGARMEMTLDLPREGACQLLAGTRGGSEDPLEGARRAHQSRRLCSAVDAAALRDADAAQLGIAPASTGLTTPLATFAPLLPTQLAHCRLKASRIGRRDAAEQEAAPAAAIGAAVAAVTEVLEVADSCAHRPLALVVGHERQGPAARDCTAVHGRACVQL